MTCITVTRYEDESRVQGKFKVSTGKYAVLTTVIVTLLDNHPE